MSAITRTPGPLRAPTPSAVPTANAPIDRRQTMLGRLFRQLAPRAICVRCAVCNGACTCYVIETDDGTTVSWEVHCTRHGGVEVVTMPIAVLALSGNFDTASLCAFEDAKAAGVKPPELQPIPKEAIGKPATATPGGVTIAGKVKPIGVQVK